MHVLVMTFLGKDGYNAPRLKDAELSEEKARPAAAPLRNAPPNLRCTLQRALGTAGARDIC